MSVKIGVISDTHSREIPRQVVSAFEKVDLIIHCGDFCSIEDFEFFSKIKKTQGVCGNMDEASISGRLPKRRILEVENASIGVYHGHGPAKKVIEFVRDEFKNDKVDAVVFGHSHQPANLVIGNILYFNPGSVTDKVYAPYRSFGLLEVNGKKIKGEIIKIENHNG